MKVGDLVRWMGHGDIGIFMALKEGRWKPFCKVYLFKEAEIYHINISELEIVHEKERQTKEDQKEEVESEI